MPKTLLLADASVTMRKVVEMSFASENIVVITADNGDEAIAKAREQGPDVVLVNVGIPGTDGYDVCDAIKSDSRLAHVPVLLLTGTFEPFDEARAEAARADGRIMKPFESQALVDRVNALLERAASAAPPAASPTPAPSQAEGTGANPPEDAFDFFDDDLEEPIATAEPAAPLEAEAELGDELEPLELDPVDEAEAPEAVATPEPAAPIAAEGAEHTVAMTGPADLGSEETELAALKHPEPEAVRSAPEGNAASTRLFSDEDDDLPALADPGPAPGDGDPGDDDAFNLDFSSPPIESTPPPPDLEAEPDRPALDDPLAQLGTEELVEEAVLDPTAARGHEVSSSDLGDPVPEPLPEAIDPADALDPDEPDTAPATTEPTLAASAEPLSPPRDAHGAPSLEAPPPGATQPTRPLPPHVREEIHSRIEKLAWEAFGDASERIVKEAVKRIEAVAWEVIPQLAEALIREEIQRLKGGDSSS